MLPQTWNTERLAVRDVCIDDVPVVMQCLTESADVAALDPSFCPAPRSEIDDLVARSTSSGLSSSRAFQMQMLESATPSHTVGYWHLMRVPGRNDAVGVSILLVRAEFRSKGYGKELILGAAEHLRACADQLWARVFLKNTGAIEFWAGLGFDRLVRHRGAFIVPHESSPSIILTKPLGDRAPPVPTLD